MTPAQTSISLASPARNPASELLPVQQQQTDTRESLFQLRVQRKLSVGAADDPLEKEADDMADKVMRMPNPEPISFSTSKNLINRKCSECEKEDELQRKESNNETVPAPPIVQDVLSSPGRSLDTDTRSFMEPRFNYDFGNVKIHDSDIAAKSASSINALAYTSGNNIVFNSGQYNSGSDSGKKLLAHELTHVVQQGSSPKKILAKAEDPPFNETSLSHHSTTSSIIQRRLILTGPAADVNSFITMSETASGLVLARDPVTNEVTAIGSSAVAATSPAYATHLTHIMDHPTQNAEIHVGQNQPNVDIGAFPVPSDLTAGGIQNVDMDDINAMEAGAPGIGVADLLHEIVENFEAHASVPAAGVDLFPAAHQAGLAAEEQVATDIVGSGRRVAQADQIIATNVTRIAEDYDTYYVMSTLTANPATRSFTRSNVSIAPKVNVIAQTIEGFATNSDVVPATGPVAIAVIVASLVANPLSTLLIEGFTDNVGTPGDNIILSEQRANAVVAALVGFGMDRGRMHIVSRGASGFAAPNTTEANRARNRRVVLTITRP